MAESLRKQLINALKQLAADADVIIDTGSSSLRETEFLLLNAILQDAGIDLGYLPSDSQERRIERCYRAFATDRAISLRETGSTSLLEQQAYYLLKIAQFENISFTYDYSWSQLYRKLVTFRAVQDVLVGPCKDNLIGWSRLTDLFQDTDDLYYLPDKSGNSNPAQIAGRSFFDFDGVASATTAAGFSVTDGFRIGAWVKCRNSDAQFGMVVHHLISTVSVQFGKQRDTEGNSIRFLLDDGLGNQFLALGIIPFNDNQWHYIEGRLNKTDPTTILRVFLDGVDITDPGFYATGPLNDFSIPSFRIGRQSNANVWNFIGGIGEIDINGNPLYYFNDKSGATIKDAVGSNDATLVSADLNDWTKDKEGILDPQPMIDRWGWADSGLIFIMPNAFGLWDKTNVTNWGMSFPGVPVGEEYFWLYDELLNIDATKEAVVMNQLWVKSPVVGPLDDVLTYSVALTPGTLCYNKTSKYTKDKVLRDEAGQPLTDENNEIILIQ